MTATILRAKTSPPRQGDGTFIENISAKWITADSVDNGDPELLYRKPNGLESQSVRLQINYALSGEHNYDPGDITITVPAHIFKNCSDQDYGNLIIPYPEDPSKKGDFNWKLVGDNYVLTNTKRMSAATKGYIQFQIQDLAPQELVDMETSDPFTGYIEVRTHADHILALRSNELKAQFDTEARLTYLNKRCNKVTRVKASQIPESQRVDGEETYIKVDWYVWGTTASNTYYTIKQTDSIPQASASETRTVVADNYSKYDENKHIRVSDAQQQYPDKNYQVGDTVVIQTEADLEGFVIGGESAKTTELVKDNAYRGYKDGNGSYYYFSTAYPARQFKPDVYYTFHNTIKYTVTEVDPEVTENLNPNVHTDGKDPQKVTTGTKTASVTWSYSDPKWINPGGHYMIHKNGNDDTKESNRTHKSIYTYSDLHLGSDGYYGIYPSAINQLQDAYEDEGEDGSVRLSYTINTLGYALPWMYNGGIINSEGDENNPARIIGNYDRPITLTTSDTGISIGRNNPKLTVFEDYTFEEIEFPNTPYVYRGKPQNINPDGTWTALDAGDGTFNYTSDSNKANWPDITLQIKRNDKWEDWATVSWKSGSRIITKHDGTTTAGSVVKVPSDTENFKTVVTLENTEAGEGATEAIQAGINYDVRAVINLKSTEDMMVRIEEAFRNTHTPAMAVYNGANMLIERADVPKDDAERQIHSIDREGYDSIRGYTTDTAVYPYKTSTQKLSEVDYEVRTILIHYEAKVEERSVIAEKKTWQEAVDEGRLQSDTHCVWRDLLPKGVTPKLSSIRLRSGDTLTDSYTIENYKGTGRTLLVVEADLKPTPTTYRSGDMTYYEDVPTIKFDAIYDFESLIDYGDDLHNVIAYESGNKQLGSVDGYTGEADDPTINEGNYNNVATKNAFNNKDADERIKEKVAMADLDKDPDHDVWNNFVYAGAWTKIDILSAARTSLYKDVQVNNDGIWSDGTYYEDIYGEPTEATEGGRMRTVYEGGQYSYRLRIMSDPDTISTDLIMYDSLENFEPTYDPEDPLGSDNDWIDAREDGDPDFHWQGTFRGVDTSQLEELGCAPTIYYSTIEKLQLSDEDDPDAAHATNTDLSNSDVWVKAEDYDGDLADVKAIAIDCSMASDKADELHKDDDGHFRIQPMESIMALVKMQAPSGEDARHYLSDEMNGHWGKSGQAYNNAYLLCTSIDKNTGDYDSDNFVRKDYTKVGLQEYSLKATKEWNDDDDRDGKRPDNVTFRLFADGEDTGITKELNAAEGETEVVFEHIPYTTPEGDKIHYTIKEDAVEDYTASYDIDENTYEYTNTHVPERIALSGAKTWEGDEDNEEARPSSIDIELYANGKKVQTKTVRPDSKGNWTYEFTNLYRYEKGEEIEYTIKEVKTPNTGDALDSYIPDVDGLDVTNTYNPFGDLKVSKIIAGTTEVSEDAEFAFTFEFTEEKEEDGETVDAPVFDEFDYEILDKDGKPVLDDEGEPLTGKVTTNGEVKIKGGQTIHVTDIPEYIKYTVTEEELDGFTLTSASGSTGIIEPNKTAKAEFTNTYSAKGQYNPTVKKVLYNRTLTKYQFGFELYEVTENDEGEEVEELKSTATSGSAETVNKRDDGTVDSSEATATFNGLRYTQEDHGKTFRYRIREIDRGKDGYTYTKDICELEVSVTDNGDGTLKIEPVYKDAEGNPVTPAVFENTYEAEGNTTLLAWKSLTGRSLEEDEFTFELLDENGDPIENEDGTAVTVKNKSNGTVTFDPTEVEALNYDEKDIGKTYYYAIREKKGSDETVIYDGKVYGYTVKIIDNDDGTLYAEQSLATPVFDADDPDKIVSWETEGARLPVFENELKDGGFSITKTTVDSEEADPTQEFRFKVRLIGDRVTDDLVKDYTITPANDDSDTPQSAPKAAPKAAAMEIADAETDTDEDTDTASGVKTAPKAVAKVSAASAPAKAAGETVLYSGKIDALTDTSIWNFTAIIYAAPAGTGKVYWTGVRDDVNGNGSKYSGVDWRITSDGELIIGKEGEAQYFYPWRARQFDIYPNTSQSGYMVPTSQRSAAKRCYTWYPYRNQIKSVRFEGTVYGQGDMNGMFNDFTKLESVDFDGFDTSRANGLGYLFYNDSKLTTIKNLDKLDTSQMTWMNYTFFGCSSLKEIDVSNITTPSLTYFGWMFSGCSSVEYLDLSGFDQRSPRVVTTYTTSANATMYMNNFFDNCTKLNTIVLGPDFSFKSRNDTTSVSTLPTPPNGQRWVRQEGPPVESQELYTSEDLRDKYTSSWAGIWVWSGKTFYTVHFLADEAAGGISPVRFIVAEGGKLPANTFQKFGYDFDHWVVTDEDGEPITDDDGNKITYEDKAPLPPNVYAMGEHVYLKAVFKQRDTSVDMNDGEFEIILKAGEKATFDNIPAGTAYQIYEETPHGWVLVSQENVSGEIKPLVTSAASFVNRYEPGTTSVQFYGTKALDSRAAAADAYEFVLKDENGEEVETVSTLEGGFIQFSPIVYKEADVGTHTYTIEEKDPGDDAIDWDTHQETVTVTVEKDGDDLVANVEYDTDGVKFTNKTRPGILKLTKAAEGLTDANKDDEFTFKITLNNADGMPLGDEEEIYWYTEKNEDADGTRAPNIVRFEAPKLAARTAPLTDGAAAQNKDKADNAADADTTDDKEEPNTAAQEESQTKGKSGSNAKAAPALRAPAAKAIPDLKSSDGDPVDFGYTGQFQTYTVEESGFYQIEAWGAQGGKSCLDAGERDLSSQGLERTERGHALGGCGGYTSGKIFLKKGTKLYLYVGGKGADGVEKRNSAGGWNGGGIGANDGTPASDRGETDGGGGGATDVRLVSGNWNAFDSLKSRIMVAGGGGGAGDTGHGGDAGGLDSTAGYMGAHSAAYVNATLAYQTSGNAFGAGQNGTLLAPNYPSAGGGGGWYGGKHPALEVNPNNTAQNIWQNAGSGGSSYISGHSGCNSVAEDSISSSIRHTGQAEHYSGYIFTDTQMISGYKQMKDPQTGMTVVGHTGNGYARISPLDFEVKFVANNDLGETFTKDYRTDIVLPSSEDLGFANGDKIFAGWALAEDAEVPDYQAGETYTLTSSDIPVFYAVWIDPGEYIIRLDANGGYTSAQRIRVSNIEESVELPTPTMPGTEVFAGWNEKKDGSGAEYQSPVTGEMIGATPGQTITLYAQWIDGQQYAIYKVEHYKQNAGGDGYSLYESERIKVERAGSDKVSPEEKEYEGYIIKDHDEEYALPDPGKPGLVVKYYYDLLSYEVAFDGNGATSGQMLEHQPMTGGRQEALRANEYHKKGSIFTGWNTKDDGTGTGYVDKQKVKNLTRENGGIVTLYAQWLANEEGQLTPTNGEIIVKCKAGETIVIPDLPAGTTYTIEEIDNPAGWSQKGELDGNGETIKANVTSQATATNEYKAKGAAQLNAHKVLAGADIEEGQFTFELLDEEGEVIDTKTNGAVDDNEQVLDDDDNVVKNPYYKTSLVEFDPLQYTQEDIGKTYTYRIREVTGDEPINYDVSGLGEVEVEVTITDAGGGALNAEITYKTDEALEPIFRNKMKPAKLKISKTIVDATAAAEEDEFTFTVELLDADGEVLDGEYDAVKGEDELTVRSGDQITLMGGEEIVIKGLPGGASYKVTEEAKDDWEMTGSSGTEGDFAAGETEEASFENTYHEPEKKPYNATGEVQFKASKEVEGGLILEDDNFTFELTDEQGEAIQSKSCDDVTGDDGNVSESEITFDKITYDINDLEYDEDAVAENVKAALQEYQNQYDADKAEYDQEHAGDENAKPYMDFGVWVKANTDYRNVNELMQALDDNAREDIRPEGTFIYYVREVAGDDPDVTYDKTRYYYKVHAVDQGDGTIKTDVTCYRMGDEDTEVNDITFTNIKTTQVKVYKKWMDNDDQDGYRPTKEEFAEKIHLMAAVGDDDPEEVKGAEPIVMEDKDGNMTVIYEDLPAYEDGVEIVYTVREDSIEHYEPKGNVDEVEDGGTFTNIHTPEKTKVTADKEWIDPDNEDGRRDNAEARLQLYKKKPGKEPEAVGDPVKVGTNEGWSHTWNDLPVFEDKEKLTYSVKEFMGENSGYTGEAGAPVIAEEGNSGNIKVTNTYEAKGDITFKGIKSIDSRDLLDGEEYTFTVSEGEEVLQTIKSDGADGDDPGKINFEKIEYVLKDGESDLGEHTYTIKEEKVNADGITSDTNEYKVTVNVTDNKDGTLKVTTLDGSDDPDKLDFENTYEASGSTEFKVKKLLEGRDWKKADSFSIRLKAVDGAPMPEGAEPEEADDPESPKTKTVTIDKDTEDLTAGFGDIEFTVADMVKDGKYVKEKTFTYEVNEIIPADEDKALYMAYDENTYIATVTVTDDTKGKLHTKVSWSIKGSEDEASVDEGVLEVGNVYEATKLKLTKKMDERIALPEDKENATVVFRIIGTDKDGKVIYENHVGLTFDEKSRTYETRTIRDVPINAEITVEEVYGGNYTSEDGNVKAAELKEVDGEMIWVVEFENTPTDDDFTEGIVNKYEYTEDEVEYVGDDDPKE